MLSSAISEWAAGMVVKGTGGTAGTEAGGTGAVVARAGGGWSLRLLNVLYCRGLGWLVLGWVRRWQMKGTGHSVPPINGKDNLAVSTTFQSRLLKEADML